MGATGRTPSDGNDQQRKHYKRMHLESNEVPMRCESGGHGGGGFRGFLKQFRPQNWLGSDIPQAGDSISTKKRRGNKNRTFE
jgi:hypothetical protein